MRLRLAAVALCAAIGGCSTSGLYVSQKAREDLKALTEAAPEVLFELTPPANQATKPAVAQRLIDDCAEPALQLLYDRMDEVAKKSFGNTHLFLLQGLPYAQAFDEATRACFKRHGAEGAVFWFLNGVPRNAEASLQLWAGLSRAASVPIMPGPVFGCGSRGGPGYRRLDGRCAAWTD